MGKIIVIGGGGHAKVLISILHKAGWDILGYTDRKDRGDILDVPYMGNDDILSTVIREHPSCKAIVGVGKIDISSIRRDLQDRVEQMGFEFPAVVSPHAMVNRDVQLGAGTLVCDGAVVNSGVVTGRACIINSNSTVEHDCRLGDDVHIAPGATISGGVTIGHHCLIGVGASVIQTVRIIDNCLIGAGATVVKDIHSPGFWVGTPTRRIR